ncbi:glycosyl transferase family 90 [Luteibaculum oceani]|uniref:Lipopolysaccharide A protein n=1 Tax=Luteibaculum oceani TaxID=1294296 RepID=A0A5C6UUF6_9FLAO|nr:glycosyl transferase family 90 [Luteibaculum oceani]TXC76260.1 lipopolysaccharide A protein [Luteibaculum oceani]
MPQKVIYYIKRFGYNALPKGYFRKKYSRLRELENAIDPKLIASRLDYYFKLPPPIELPAEAVRNGDIKNSRGTDYYLDLKESLQFFNKHFKISFRFGDDTSVNTYPTIVKARPIHGDNSNSILFKLNKVRHFKWVNDTREFKDKIDQIVWRGGAYQPLRKLFVKKFHNHPMCNFGQTNVPVEHVPWQREFLSIQDQLKYKFIFCPEGNDVATNLKWAMSSNSLVVMPKPRFETWFMEGKLKAGVHYAEVNDDGSNLEELIEFYISNPSRAQEIIANAHEWVKGFQNRDLEELLCLKVLERYGTYTGQKNFLKF